MGEENYLPGEGWGPDPDELISPTSGEGDLDWTEPTWFERASPEELPSQLLSPWLEEPEIDQSLPLEIAGVLPQTYQLTLRRLSLRRRALDRENGLYMPEELQVAVSLNEQTGMMRHGARHSLVCPPIEDFPALPLTEEAYPGHDEAKAERTFKTAFHDKLGKSSLFNEAEAVRARGGDPDYRIPKPSGGVDWQEED